MDVENHLEGVEVENNVRTITTGGIQGIPNEILSQIFALLSLKDKTQLALVCRRWEELARDPSLYRKLVFTEHQPSTRMAVKLVKMAPQLVSLSMKGRKDADEILRHVGSETPRLKVLRLFECRGSPECYEIFPKYLKNVFMCCTRIREIQMRTVLDQYETWLNIVKYCQDIETLSVKCIQDDDLLAIFEKFCHSLKILQIYGCVNIDQSLLTVARCINLTTLLLSPAWKISKESLSAIGEMPNLRDLEIARGDRMTRECWRRMFQKPMIKRLTRLALHLCREVDDEVLRVIMKNSKVLKALVTSNYNDETRLTLDEVKQLTSHLKLDELDIDTNGLHISATNGVYLSEVNM